MSLSLPQCDNLAAGRLIKAFFCLQLLLLMPLVVLAAEPMRLAVVGITNETDEAEFGKLLISEGIAHLVAQELYDTGRYVPVEDNAEISANIQELTARPATSSEVSALPATGTELGCDAVASVRIVKFEKSRFRGFAGPFSSSKVDISIDVEVSVQEQGKASIKTRGSGRGITKARGMLFQVREDQVHFDQTSAGQAIQEAVAQAVTGLITQIEEEP